jgi:hypothetical protein
MRWETPLITSHSPGKSRIGQLFRSDFIVSENRTFRVLFVLQQEPFHASLAYLTEPITNISKKPDSMICCQFHYSSFICLPASVEDSAAINLCLLNSIPEAMQLKMNYTVAAGCLDANNSKMENQSCCQ